MHSRLPILVIGAGPAGLGAMISLKNKGLPFEGVERASNVGGLWNPANPYTPAYDSLHTNSSKATTHLGESMPKEWPAYPSKHHAFEYLNDFSNKHDLKSNILFNTEVKRLWKNTDSTWMATLQDRNNEKERSFRAVIVATGVHNKQNRIIPENLWKNAIEQQIEVLHASDYRNGTSFRGKRVLILGIGNSASEIATEVCEVADSTTLSIRTSPWVVPLWALGKPADVLAQGVQMPHRMNLFIFHILQRWYVGHPKKLGFPNPTHGLLDVLPLSDRGIAKALREKKIQIRSCLKGLKNKIAYFEKATDEPLSLDTLIFATGYERKFSFLPDGESKYYSESIEKFPYLIFHPTEENLMFMTEVVVAQSNWALYRVQGEALAAYLHAGQIGSPTYQNFLEKRTHFKLDFKGPLFARADHFHVDARRYTNELKEFTRWISQS